MSKSKPEDLIKKYVDNTCTPEERATLESWYNDLAESAESPEDIQEYEQLDHAIWKQLKKTSRPARKIHWPLVAAAAAACILICSLFYRSALPPEHQSPVAVSNLKILPGSNKAELLLDDGTLLPLSDDKAELLNKAHGVTIRKYAGGRLSYDTSPSAAISGNRFNVLRTPKGGQYQIELPDGTKAWLNAASSLRFPTAFSGTERRVEISGEVYFEVAVNKHKPFKVSSLGQTVTVLGTHFNVSAYPDESLTRTSLIEGSVQVSSEKHTVVIKPGEQSLVDAENQQISVRKTDLEEAIAWRQGYFQFNNEDVKSIMRKLSRWYDIEVEYTKDFVNQRFSGSVSRFEDAGKVLKMLEYTGTVHFKTEGRRVTVMP